MHRMTLANTISLQSVVVVTNHLASCDLNGEEIILNLADGVYHSLDPVGARIWALIQEPRTIDEVRTILLGEYDVEPDRCTQELLALLGDLAKHGLVEVSDGIAA